MKGRWNRLVTSSFSVLCRWAIALITATLLPDPAVAAAPSSWAVVRPDPLVAVVPVGGQVVVHLYVQDVQNLYGADIRLSFDPEILEVQDANPSVNGVQIQPLNTFLMPDYVAKNKACNAVVPGDLDCPLAGIVRYAVTQVNPNQPVSGSGPLAAVTFRRLKPDVTALKIIAHDLSDRNGVMIPSLAQVGRVELAPIRKLYLPMIAR